MFFGSAFLGFEQAEELSELFGAPLMVLFVAISVLMLYTLLISIFSQTFSDVSIGQGYVSCFYIISFLRRSSDT